MAKWKSRGFRRQKKSSAALRAILLLFAFAAGYTAVRVTGRDGSPVLARLTGGGSERTASSPVPEPAQQASVTEAASESPGSASGPALADKANRLPTSPGGASKKPLPPSPEALAKLAHADSLFHQYTEESVAHKHWDEIRAAYAEAYRAIDQVEKRQHIVQRICKLNSWLIPHPRASSLECKDYVVCPGDSLARISRRVGVPIGALQRLNGMSPDESLIRVGERLHVVSGEFSVEVDKSTCTLAAYLSGKLFLVYPVGLGKIESPTPEGEFTIETKLVNPTWWYKGNRIPPGSPDNLLGCRWMGFSRSSVGRGYGIHGTTDSESVPGYTSGGCIRLLAPNVKELYDFLPKGTTVTVVP